ncbi:hypothetical protein CQZ91_17270 [Bacillus cereus]|nr:hypothetical protein CQZ92_19505 [Bacillus cereus]PRD02863.1 hypothetical protein CQZ91_17270 [Bacillus cereus]
MKIYRRFFEYIYHNLKYINDFFNISTIRQGISIYRQRMTIKAIPHFIGIVSCFTKEDIFSTNLFFSFLHLSFQILLYHRHDPYNIL